MNGVLARGVGAIAGAAVGDAAGTPLEFSERPTRAEVRAALGFPGGGPFAVGPGQVTDDTELAMAGLGALLALPPGLDPTRREGRERLQRALHAAYAAWYWSGPFDVGRTTRTAFGDTDDTSPDGVRRPARLVDLDRHLRGISRDNGWSKANGAMMRATPIAVRFHGDALAVDAAARADAELSHPACADANRLYCAVVAELVRSGDAGAALSLAEQLAAGMDADVRECVPDLGAGEVAVPRSASGRGSGHWKHGLRMALAHLRLGSSYEAAIEQTIAAGGDTDTNAAIVGGVMGAWHGIGGIPAAWRAAVLDAADTDRHGRPAWSSPRARWRDMVELVRLGRPL
jgi:ADP-ribosylglycohydrolase